MAGLQVVLAWDSADGERYWPVLAGAVAGVSAVWVRVMSVAVGSRVTPASRMSRVYTWLLTSVLLLLFFAGADSGLPIEYIKTSTDEKLLAAYVIDVDDVSLTMIYAFDGGVRRIPTAKVVGRTICAGERLSLVERLFIRPEDSGKPYVDPGCVPRSP
jgi:hypothetical protein